MCIYGLLSFVITYFEEESLQVYSQTLHSYTVSLTSIFCDLSRVPALSLCMWQSDGVASQCSHLIDAACEVLSAPSLAEVFWEMVRKKNKIILQRWN